MKKYSFDAVIFDLDGVVTKTAILHSKAWKATFDQYLKQREKKDNEPFREFTHENDYLPFVDGKPKYEGVRGFLESREINIPFGDPSDIPDKETICGIGNKKNGLFRQLLKEKGAGIYPTTLQFIKVLKELGIRIGVASSSRNCEIILESVGLEKLFETRVDGVVSVQLKLKGKPEGDIFVTAAHNLETVPARVVVVEDAISGIQAGRNGGFGLVIGVARHNNESELIENGADIVVSDLAEISIEYIEKWFHRKPLSFPSFLENNKEIINNLSDNRTNEKDIIINPHYNQNNISTLFKKRKVIFLDYDGTLTPIVERPELAVLSSEMRETIKHLIEKHTVAIVSGRMREDVEKLVGIKGIFYAGSHGFDIMGPGFSMMHPQAEKIVPVVSQAIKELSQKLDDVPNIIIEKKKFSVAVHYRLVAQQYLSRISETVNKIVQEKKELRLMSGKKVFEILPNIDWDKGKAVRWIMNALEVSWRDVCVVYIGDDVTDEYAFRTLRTRGLGFLVSNESKESAADFRLSSTEEVKKLFKKVVADA
ncbi:trehalose-phosphatase [bacterium]|nr:trehalose-phosphatase [bacterium]